MEGTLKALTVYITVYVNRVYPLPALPLSTSTLTLKLDSSTAPFASTVITAWSSVPSVTLNLSWANLTRTEVSNEEWAEKCTQVMLNYIIDYILMPTFSSGSNTHGQRWHMKITYVLDDNAKNVYCGCFHCTHL